MVDQAEMQAGIPQSGAGTALTRGLQGVERSLRQRERHVRPGGHLRNSAEELSSPWLREAAGIADFETLEVGQRINPTASLVLLDCRLAKGPAAGAARQDKNQSARETDTQGGDGIGHVAL